MNKFAFKHHRAVNAVTKWSPVKRWSIAVVSLVVALLLWSQVSPTSFFNAWLSKDQQAMIHFRHGQFKQASALFESPVWKAYSSYFSGDFPSAIEQFEHIESSDKPLVIANSLAHSGQFEKAQQLYKALYQNDSLSEAAKINDRLMSKAIEQVKNSPPEKSTKKSIDDRQIASEEADKKAGETIMLSDQAWLGQVRQNPSNFLRQKFQHEYANEQE